VVEYREELVLSLPTGIALATKSISKSQDNQKSGCDKHAKPRLYRRMNMRQEKTVKALAWTLYLIIKLSHVISQI